MGPYTMLLVACAAFITSIFTMVYLARQQSRYRCLGIMLQILCMCAVFGSFFWILVSLIGLSVLDM